MIEDPSNWGWLIATGSTLLHTPQIRKLIATLSGQVILPFKRKNELADARANAEIATIEAETKAAGIDKISQAKARAIETDALAKARAAVIKEQGKVDAALVKQDTEEGRIARARINGLLRAERQQANLEAIVAEAAEQIQNNDANEEPVEPDWIAQFLNSCKDISNEQMQTVWAKLLAGEIAKPGTFSMRTLAVVKTLASVEADLFTRLCSMVWHRKQPIVITPEDSQLLVRWGIELTFNDFVRLETCGLIKFAGVGGFCIKSESDNAAVCMSYHDKIFFVSRKVPDEFRTGPVFLTSIGQELYDIAGGQPNIKYLEEMLKLYRGTGWEFEEKHFTQEQIDRILAQEDPTKATEEVLKAFGPLE